jgi:hypothetical protein
MFKINHTFLEHRLALQLAIACIICERARGVAHGLISGEVRCAKNQKKVLKQRMVYAFLCRDETPVQSVPVDSSRQGDVHCVPIKPSDHESMCVT